MKSLLALTLMIAAIAVFSVCAFGSSPPVDSKAKPAVVQVQSTDIQQVAPVIVQTNVDQALALPVERIDIVGEIAKAQRYERRFELASPDPYNDWITDVPNPPNETAFNGFANVRAREQV